MDIKYHKHKGVESRGKLKSHPIKTQHKDPIAIKYHNIAIGKTTKKTKSTKKLKFVKLVKQESNIDDDGFEVYDLRLIKTKGIRILGPKAGKIWFASDGDIKGIQFDK